MAFISELSSVSLITRGDTTLNRDRSRLFRFWASSSEAVKEAFDEIYLDLESQLSAQMFNTSNTMLLPAQRAMVRERLRRELSTAIAVTEEAIEHSVSTAIARSQSAHVAYLQRMGAAIPSNQTLSRIRTGILRNLDNEYPPGSGISFRNRMDRMFIHHSRQLSTVVGNVHLRGNARERILRDARSALIYPGPGNTPVIGGSLYRQSRRLLVAEETRAANQVEIATARSAGVSYAYWRLSPEHKWYGGNEICEVLANNMNYDLRDIKIGNRRIPAGRLRGLYRMDSWPAYPHPFCKCHPEPAFF